MGKKVSFYSFKGGSGRSTGLCNVAYALAEDGARVGCIDLDVEAAGLNFIFDVPAGRLRNCRKLQEFIIEERRRRTDGIDDFVLDLGSVNEYDLDGELYMIPAGADPSLTQELPSDLNMMQPIEELYQRFESQYDLDYLFIDTRSGVSSLAVPSILNADEVAIFFRWSRQHREGTKTLVSWLRSKILAFDDASIYSVASNIPREVSDEDIGSFVETELPDVRGNRIVYESDLLKEEEQILVQTHPEDETSERYREIAADLQT